MCWSKVNIGPMVQTLKNQIDDKRPMNFNFLIFNTLFLFSYVSKVFKSKKKSLRVSKLMRNANLLAGWYFQFFLFHCNK